jgi:hypothetical protein
VLGVLALAGGGQRGATGGVVAVLLVQVVGELGVGGEGTFVEAIGGDVPVLVLLTGGAALRVYPSGRSAQGTHDRQGLAG